MADIPISKPETGLIVHPTLGRESAQFQQIVKYVEALKDGKKPRQAAREAGTTINMLRLQGKAVSRYLAKSRSEYKATAEELREVVILKWTEKALADPTDPNYDARETMMALHELSAIPEVGLKGKALPSTTGELQFSEETQQVLDSVDIEEGD